MSLASICVQTSTILVREAHVGILIWQISYLYGLEHAMPLVMGMDPSEQANLLSRQL